MATVAEPRSREAKKLIRQALCTLFACVGFLLLVIGLTYFALLAASVALGDAEMQARAYRELGFYLGGELEWFRDARLYGGGSLLAALVSVLLGRHPFARITIPVAAILYVVLYFFDDTILEVVKSWAEG